MMKNFKRLFTFLLLGVLFFSMALVGCGDTLAETKEKGVEAIDTYMQEIRDMDLEYSLVLIEREAERGKQAIEGAEDETQATALKEETLNAMKALVLTDEEETAIKQTFAATLQNAVLDEIAIEGCYGRYNNAIAVLIKERTKGDTGETREVTVAGVVFEYPFGNREISVFYQERIYTVTEAYEAGLLSDADVLRIATDSGFLKN